MFLKQIPFQGNKYEKEVPHMDSNVQCMHFCNNGLCMYIGGAKQNLIFTQTSKEIIILFQAGSCTSVTLFVCKFSWVVTAAFLNIVQANLTILYFPLGEFVRAKRKSNLGNVIGQRKNSPRKSWISSHFFTVRANKFA